VSVFIYTQTYAHKWLRVCVCVPAYVLMCACKVPLCISYSDNGAQATCPGKSAGKAEGEQVVGKGINSFSFSGWASEANTFLLC